MTTTAERVERGTCTERSMLRTLIRGRLIRHGMCRGALRNAALVSEKYRTFNEWNSDNRTVHTRVGGMQNSQCNISLI